MGGDGVVTEYELACTSCGGSLTRATVDPSAVGAPVTGRITVAQCGNCGVRHFPRETLEELGREKPGRR